MSTATCQNPKKNTQKDIRKFNEFKTLIKAEGDTNALKQSRILSNPPPPIRFKDRNFFDVAAWRSRALFTASFAS